jgi:ketosteroid isomerase-like protein
MRAIAGIAVSLALGLTAGCQPKAETPEQAQARMDTESAAARTAIDSLDREFTLHFNQGHADIVAGFYAEQAHAMPPNEPVAVGREAIKTALGLFMAMKAELKLTADAVVANGPLAIERGTYTVSFTPPGATAPVTDTGKYLVHWHQIEGKWLLVDDIWNSNLPAMPMGPPAKNP